MKKFKNKLAIFGTIALRKAILSELEELGYDLHSNNLERWDVIHTNVDNLGIINAGPIMLTTGGFIKCNLPQDWNKVIQLASEVVEEVPEYVKCTKSGIFTSLTDVVKGSIWKTDTYNPMLGDARYRIVWKDGSGQLISTYNEQFFIPATEQEYNVQQEEFRKKELLEEAKRRFKIGDKVKLFDGDIIEIEGTPYCYNSNTIWNSTGYGRLYDNGKWVNVVENNIIEIAGYKAEVKDNKIAFGCKKFSREDLQAIKQVQKICNNTGLDFTFNPLQETTLIYEGRKYYIFLEDINKLIDKIPQF